MSQSYMYYLLALVISSIFLIQHAAQGKDIMIEKGSGAVGKDIMVEKKTDPSASSENQISKTKCKGGKATCSAIERSMESYFEAVENSVEAFQQVNKNVEEILKLILDTKIACDGGNKSDGKVEGEGEPKTDTTTKKPTTEPNHLQIRTIPSNAKWMQNGTTIAGGHGHGGGLNQLNHLHGLAVDDNGTVFIADTGNNRIVAWKEGDKEGRVMAGGNGEGNQFDQLLHPTDVLIDRETNSLLICDWLNRRIMRWSRQSGTTRGEMMFDNIGCWGLTMDNEGSIYVTDAVKHEVRRYRRGEKFTTGTLVAGGNGQGNGLNQFSNPRYISVDHEHAVYVSDNGNNRVMKWVKGAKEGTVVAGGQGPGTNLTQLNSPNGIFVDTKGTLYVADFANLRVMRYRDGENKGEIIVGANGERKEANQLGGPVDLSFDRHGHLYVVDYTNARVQRFSIAKTT